MRPAQPISYIVVLRVEIQFKEHCCLGGVVERARESQRFVSRNVFVVNCG